jgi:hypothetical protein
VLPDFVVIGAGKCGTTSLGSYLAEHPQIFMGRNHEFNTEMNFFTEPDWRERIDWYRAQFEDAGDRIKGEKSVHYTMHPFRPSVAEPIHEVLPDAKLIYMVRDPIPRAVSHYVQKVVIGAEDRPIDEAFGDLEDPANEYVCTGRYASQLNEYLRFFPADRILVADQSELLEDREEVLSRVFRFLGVDDTYRPERLDEMMLTRKRQMKQTAVGWRLRNTRAAHMVRRLPAPIGGPLANAARRIFYKPVEQNPTLSPELQKRLADILRPEARELREMTGLSIDAWSV